MHKLTFVIAVFLVLTSQVSSQPQDSVDSSDHYLAGGLQVPPGELEAVGIVNSDIGSCTGTLIHATVVLTAGHCVCSGQDEPVGCAERASFTFTDVYPTDDPDTQQDESASRANVTIEGDVTVHPDYTVGGWLRNDYAVIVLDEDASGRVPGIDVIQVENPTVIPEDGDTVTLVGYGRTASDCTQSSAGKMKVDVEIEEVRDDTIILNDPDRYSCPGDSGGPALDARGRIVGVSSSGNFSGNSNYDPTYTTYSWLTTFGIQSLPEPPIFLETN